MYEKAGRSSVDCLRGIHYIYAAGFGDYHHLFTISSLNMGLEKHFSRSLEKYRPTLYRKKLLSLGRRAFPVLSCDHDLHHDVHTLLSAQAKSRKRDHDQGLSLLYCRSCRR